MCTARQAAVGMQQQTSAIAHRPWLVLRYAHHVQAGQAFNAVSSTDELVQHDALHDGAAVKTAHVSSSTGSSLLYGCVDGKCIQYQPKQAYWQSSSDSSRVQHHLSWCSTCGTSAVRYSAQLQLVCSAAGWLPLHPVLEQHVC